MTADVVDLTTKRRAKQADGILQVYVYMGTKISRAAYDAIVEADGTVRIDFKVYGTLRLGPEALRELDSDIGRLWSWQQDVVRRLSGADRWIARPAGANDSYYVRHDGEERLFRPTRVGARRPYRNGRPRDAQRCEACKHVLQVGETAWTEAFSKPWASPNWRGLKLCEACIRREVHDKPVEAQARVPEAAE